jgi:hypothetical protein
MDLKVNIRQTVKATVDRLEPSRPWAPALAVHEGGSPGGPGTRQSGMRQYSYWAECGCPGDCLRDHENE